VEGLFGIDEKKIAFLISVGIFIGLIVMAIVTILFGIDYSNLLQLKNLHCLLFAFFFGLSAVLVDIFLIEPSEYFLTGLLFGELRKK